MQMVKCIYEITSRFSETEKFKIVSKLRRVAVSVACNVAEGSRRNTKKEFGNFLYISSASASELEMLLSVSKELGYLEEFGIRNLEH